MFPDANNEQTFGRAGPQGGDCTGAGLYTSLCNAMYGRRL